ncbi:MAG TPA: hypothetical protein VGP02_03260 [Mycobacteriales bacterium]|nr:hypothetical protein [Mycobacteriales bacterium]
MGADEPAQPLAGEVRTAGGDVVEGTGQRRLDAPDVPGRGSTASGAVPVVQPARGAAEAVGGLRSLRVLDLRDNALAMVPECLGALDLLRQLDLRGNRLTDALSAAAVAAHWLQAERHPVPSVVIRCQRV